MGFTATVPDSYAIFKPVASCVRLTWISSVVRLHHHASKSNLSRADRPSTDLPCARKSTLKLSFPATVGTGQSQLSHSVGTVRGAPPRCQWCSRTIHPPSSSALTTRTARPAHPKRSLGCCSTPCSTSHSSAAASVRDIVKGRGDAPAGIVNPLAIPPRKGRGVAHSSAKPSCAETAARA